MCRPCLLAVLAALASAPAAYPVTLKSPDQRLSADIRVDSDGNLVYSVARAGAVVIDPSRIGVRIDGADCGAGVKLTAAETYALDENYRVLGGRRVARNHCRGVRIRVEPQDGRAAWTLDCRAYDGGFAFRMELPGEGARRIAGEATAFTLPADARCWFFERASDWKLKTYAGEWRSAPVTAMAEISPTGPVQGPPLVFVLPGAGGYAAISEAALFDYSGMRLAATGERSFAVDYTEPEGFELSGAVKTPWRVVLATADLDGLVNAEVITSLCPPPDPALFADTGYIKPGRCVWRWWSQDTGTPEEERAFVDQAVRLGFEYSLVDEGWKKWPDCWDALACLCRYAAEKKVGVWVWSHWQDLNDPAGDYAALADFLDRVAEAGVVGVKIDFMNGEDLARTRFNEAVLRQAARRRLMVNFHGCGKPTGESRTYPNELTREAIRGLELNRMGEPLPPAHDAALPFTRLVVGPGDYTPLTVTAERMGRTTLAHQLATFVALTSPLQVLAENPGKLLDNPQLAPVVEMLRGVPAVWDETRVLPGSAIGELAVLARRTGSVWYVAGVNGADPRDYTLPTEFLDGPYWRAELIADADHPLAFRSEATSLTRGATVALKLAAGGGFVMRLTPDAGAQAAWELKERADGWSIVSAAYTLKLHRAGGRLEIAKSDGAAVAPAHATHGLEIFGGPVAEVADVERVGEALRATVRDGSGRTGEVTIRPGRRHVEIAVTLAEAGDVAIQFGGIAPAYGLGDYGGQYTSADLTGYAVERMYNDGGTKKCRFFAPFAVFPKQGFAGVVFWPGPVSAAFAADAYRLVAHGAVQVRFDYFVGDMPEIYAEYRAVRHAEGYPDVKPKFRFFELGWESWDALRWDTNQRTVQAILQRYLDHGYPLRWAVTGSGFWGEGGTTTSFGAWNPEKYPDPRALLAWMHAQDVDWLIGLRTNFVVADGPFTPEGLARGYYMRDPDGSWMTRKSGCFPRVDCYVLDGTIPEAVAWYQGLYERWGVDGIKEDTMLKLPRADVYNGPMTALADDGALVMARNGAYSVPGTLLRMEDMVEIDTITARMPITYLQYAASAAPNVYCDAVGFGGMQENPKGATRHAWLSALTAGMSMGAEPWTWSAEDQASLEKAIRFHAALAPYLYSAAMDSYTTGYPHTLTPLPIAFPDDAHTYDLARHETQQYAWMVGPNLLATPFLRSDYRTNDRMEIYLPAGEWLDYDTGERFTGPQTLEGFAMPADKTPCFVGGDGVLVLRGPAEQLSAVVYPLTPQPGEFRFVYPDGVGRTRILKANAGWDADSLRIVDSTDGAEVAFTRNAANGALRFAIEPGHDYRITGGAPGGAQAKP